MSRTLAAGLHGLIKGLTGLKGAKRGAMTQARLVERIEAELVHVIETRHGPIRAMTARGPHLAAAALGFADEEPELLAWIDGFPKGARFWDVGAATGLFSIYAALQGAEVTAFEPKATSYGVLVEHLALNGLGDRVLPLPVAFSDTTEVTRLSLSAMAAGSGGNSVGGHANQFGQHAAVFNQGALAYRLDDFAAAFGLGAPDYLKIDVDGVEPLILAGGPGVLRAVKAVMIEVEGENAARAAALIDPPIKAAGLVEKLEVRDQGSKRNRLYVRA